MTKKEELEKRILFSLTWLHNHATSSQCAACKTVTNELRDLISTCHHQKTEKMVKSLKEDLRWCAWCGDELECFGCQVMPERTMKKNMEIQIEKALTIITKEDNE